MATKEQVAVSLWNVVEEIRSKLGESK